MENRSVVAKIWGSGGVGREVDVTPNWNRKGLCSDGNIHYGYPGCDTVRVLQDVTSFTRWNWVKGVEDLYYFLQLCVSLCEKMKVLVAQLCPTLWDPMDCSPLGSSVHGILQARILEWVAIPFYRGFLLTKGTNPDHLHCRQILYCLSHQGSSKNTRVDSHLLLWGFFLTQWLNLGLLHCRWILYHLNHQGSLAKTVTISK